MGVDYIIPYVGYIIYIYLRTYSNKLLKFINILCIKLRINSCIYYREKYRDLNKNVTKRE